MERIDEWKWRLSSGRELYVVCDTIGLNLADGTIHSGHDHTFDEATAQTPPSPLFPEDPQPWTPAERAEIADAMIAQWQQFKAASSDQEARGRHRVHSIALDFERATANVALDCGHVIPFTAASHPVKSFKVLGIKLGDEMTCPQCESTPTNANRPASPSD